MNPIQCIQCGNTPAVYGDCCQNCIHIALAALKQTNQNPDPVPSIPTYATQATAEALRVKREDAINMARALYATVPPIPGSHQLTQHAPTMQPFAPNPNTLGKSNPIIYFNILLFG
ncbi:hypothetical protein PGT21_023660 [Puccinia graminis f. sp. tritici]|uniref:Uncharacterized protein n=1 Tax=Puccinia graminis f. sp. tritici TaxID=56615 RepID=A0A5B0RDZ1_PUCGR|nr:hypothetical protein PGT21_030926 [Puccinia graminis f. sp. tritici]KAA1083107.1 hypothetical protein PGT21_025172 [Puccinia graminis f. sp. tritici]KAA1105904.1 hypothetical protein PGT21_023660 [Puccinia graminis f. sp. tritici]KAA1121021.1 hypothetical protein PGTUg99_027544 [Puccinia graminis f. sp. tritici]KAA1123960.1 hypothetical protein PGTUg99_012674 [Puccinia graminis f. sp. tritici]